MPAVTPKPYPVEIEWDDAASISGWQDPDTVLTDRGVQRCFTVGYLIRKTKAVITVVQTRDSSKWSEALTIPRSIVRRIRRLK